MKFLGIPEAVPRGRTECASPRKSASGQSGLYPFSQCPFGKPPPEGRALHAPKGNIAFTDAYHH